MNTSHLRRIGIQTQPVLKGQPFPHGSFHEAAARELYGQPFSSNDDMFSKELVCYGTHQDMIAALEKGEIDEAVIAIDNTYSGRVVSAIDTLREKKLRIIGKITIPISQHVLFHKDTLPEAATHVISQIPALNQALAWIHEHNLTTTEHHDTVDAARLVAKNSGVIDGQPTVAIASILAGQANGLMVGQQVSPSGNATTFWRIVQPDTNTEPIVNSQTSPRMAALSFFPPQRQGSLLRIIKQLSSNGINFVDIDSHLHARGQKRGFFAEVELGRWTEEDLRDMLDAFIEPYIVTINGAYEDSTQATVRRAMEMRTFVGDPSSYTMLGHRRDLAYDHNAKVLYIQASNRVGSLVSMLQALHDINILDMSRPLVPEHSNGRGFFFVLPADTSTETVEQALGKDVTHYWYTYQDLMA